MGGAGGGLDPAPFVMGLLVSVVALLAAGLAALGQWTVQESRITTMGPHGTWFDFFPFLDVWKSQAKEHLGRTWTWQVFQSTYFEINHVLMAALVVLLLTVATFFYRRKVIAPGRRRRPAASRA